MNTTLRKILLLVLFSLVFVFVACDHNESLSTGLTEEDGAVDADIVDGSYSITIGPLIGDAVYVNVPGEVFGDSDSDITGGALDVYQNGILVGSFSTLADVYIQIPNLISFNVNSLVVDDILGFAIYSGSGATSYYEGVVSDTEETEAILSVADFSTGVPGFGDIGTLFGDMQTAEGDAVGDDYSGVYTLYFDGYTYSEDCDVSFVVAADFYFDATGLDDFEQEIIINTGSSAFEVDVDITQNDGDLTWDDLSPTGDDYAGVLYSEGSFEFFGGDYVNENNYRYTLIQGTTNSTTVTGDFMSTITLDGTQLQNGLVGSCTVTSTFTTEEE